MNDDLPTDFRIAAQIRIAGAQGVTMTIAHKGDPRSGAIYLKINKLNGTSNVLNQIRLDNELVWIAAGEGKTMTDEAAEAYLAQQIDFDPDVWVVEVEDRQGRHWFPEKIIALLA